MSRHGKRPLQEREAVHRDLDGLSCFVITHQSTGRTNQADTSQRRQTVAMS